MRRLASCQLVLFCSILTCVCLSGCAPSGNLHSNGSEDSPSELYGWWAGRNGKERAIDIGFRGNGLQIRVVRTFMSRDKLKSPVGVGWTHNYLMHIRKASDTKLILFGADGREAVFSQTASGTFTSQEEATGVLTGNGDGTISLRDDTGDVFRFNQKGRLIHIQGKKYGNTISLAYGADGYLESVSDSGKHVITFYYDSETRRLTFIRDGEGNSSSYKHDDIGNLTSVTNARGITSAYTYDGQSNLIAVTFP